MRVRTQPDSSQKSSITPWSKDCTYASKPVTRLQILDSSINSHFSLESRAAESSSLDVTFGVNQIARELPISEERLTMDDVRVLHVADLHVDSPMHGLVPYDDSPIELQREGLRRAASDCPIAD